MDAGDRASPVPTPSRHPIRSVLEPTNLLLLACALIDGLLGEGEEAAILLVSVAAISLLDALQQRRSRRALAELARPPQAPLFGHATWRLALAGAGRGLGLWLLVLTLPRLQAWLALAPLGWHQLALGLRTATCHSDSATNSDSARCRPTPPSPARRGPTPRWRSSVSPIPASTSTGAVPRRPSAGA